MQTLSVKVARKILEADDIGSFEQRPVDDVQLPPFSAGSHVDVHLRSGLMGQYSSFISISMTAMPLKNSISNRLSRIRTRHASVCVRTRWVHQSYRRRRARVRSA